MIAAGRASRTERARPSLRRGTGLLLAGLLVASGAHGADVYKWVDENGKVHFGDRPPASDQEAETVDVKPARPTGDGGRARHERTRKMAESFERERQDRAKSRAEARAESEKRKRRCAMAKAEDQRRRTSGHLFYRQPDGTKRIIEGEEYEAALRESSEAIDKWCS